MKTALPIRDFCKTGDSVPLPKLFGIQMDAYNRFLQEGAEPTKRDPHGLESRLREMFPMASYDGNLLLHYVSYELGKARYTPDECR